MRICVFGAKPHDERTLSEAAGERHALRFLAPPLDHLTARLAEHAEAACIFVNDEADEAALRVLSEGGVRLLLLRCSGYNNVDLEAAARLGIAVARVPAYSPHAVAEHALALLLTLNRKTHRAHARVREGNFALDGLEGWDIHGKTAGIIGTGSIGSCAAQIFAGLGCRVLATDPAPSDALAGLARYVSFAELMSESDVISLHCPLTPDTHHLIDAGALALTKRGVTLINTSRGGLVDTRAVIAALKSEHLGALGLDVYEEEADMFFEDLSGHVLQDDVFARLLTFPNVLVTGHQGFFTREALRAIAETTIANATAFEEEGAPRHPVTAD
ncbi:2-hydroxyacid dehydrogenase [Parvularcula oceani]|uniref:2-hydroxyacid dehydrogenase n=1 Tax=Parvularcula oceani TaxID=1247963 RepID=UPI0004E0D550|nr:2-hydroxyacid dehydrogenase [Parvularcula oceani]